MKTVWLGTDERGETVWHPVFFTYHEFNNMADAIAAKGTVNADTWNWTAESKMGDTTMGVRVTIREVSKTEYTFKLEMSQNGRVFGRRGSDRAEGDRRGLGQEAVHSAFR